MSTRCTRRSTLQVEVHYIGYKVIHIFVVVSRKVDVTKNNIIKTQAQAQAAMSSLNKQYSSVGVMHTGHREVLITASVMHLPQSQKTSD